MIHVIHHRDLTFQLSGEVFKPFRVVDGEGFDNYSFEMMRCHWHVRHRRITKFVGFHQYRRLFMYPWIADLFSQEQHSNPWVHTIPDIYFECIRRLDVLSPKEFFSLLDNYNLIVPLPLELGSSLADHYRGCHRSEDWQVFAQLLVSEGLDPGSTTQLVGHNIFVTRWQIFMDYMRLWERVMSQARELITPSTDPYQGRVFGFLSERLFTVWYNRLRAERPELRVLSLPVVEVDGLKVL